MSTTDNALVPEPTTDESDLTNCSPTLDVRSTVSNFFSTDLKTILALNSSAPRNTPTPETTKISVEPTESFRTILRDITKVLPFLISTIYYKPETLILHMEDLNQELINTAKKYKAAVTHLKNLLLAIDDPLNILTGHLQDHQTYSSTALNINPYLKPESTIKTHHFHKANNHMDEYVPPFNPGWFLYQDILLWCPYHREDEHAPENMTHNWCIFSNQYN